MSSPSSKALGKRPADQATSAEDAALMRKMMEDLGQSRQDDLPLDDEPVRHDGGYHHRGGGGHQARLLLPAPFRIDDAWKRAIESGEFDDEEAAGVKGLDDLGGGRIYSNTLKATMRMLDQNNRNRRPPEQFAGQWTSYNQPKKKKRNRNNALPPAPMPSGSRAVSATPRAQPLRLLTPISLPARPPRVPVVVCLPPISADPNAPLSFELANVVFRAAINFQSREFSSFMSAIVLLSAAQRPTLGLFTIAIHSRQYTQWPLSLWDDYTSGADHQLCVRFVDGEGASQGYDIRFRSDKDIRDFMTTVRSLQAGSYLHMVESASPAQVAVKVPAVVVASAAPAPAPAASPAPVAATVVARMPKLAPVSTSMAGSAMKISVGSSKGPGKATTSKSVSLPAPSGFPTLARTLGPATSETQQRTDKAADSALSQPSTGSVKFAVPTAASTTNGNAEPFAVVEVTLPLSKTTDPSDQDNAPSQQTVELGNSTLIDLEADDEGDTTSLPQSEAIQLLSTLEPYDSNDTGTVAFSPEEIRKVIHVTLRGLMTFFCSQGLMTPGQADETAKGVKSGLRAHLIKDAISQRFGGQALEEYKVIIDEVLGTIPFLASDPTSVPRRLQYTAEELLSWRQGAVEPSVRLADIPHLPLPQNGRLTAGSSQQLAPCNPKPELVRYRPSQLRKSADAMQWALGENASPQQKPEAAVSSQQLTPRNRRPELARHRPAQLRKFDPQQEPEKAIEAVAATPAAATPVAVSTVTMPGVAEVWGLQSSRWATATSEIKYTKYFTGPQYEKTWSKRSYLWDLAQLDPRAKMNVGTEDIVNFYFPVKDNEDIPTSEDTQPAIDSMPVNEDTLADVSAPQPATNSSQMPNNGTGDGSRPGYATPTPHARTDSIERLRDSLSRLSIRSPVAAESQRGGISEAEESSRRPSIQASSNLSQLAAPPVFESVRLPSPVPLSSAAQPRSLSVGLRGQAQPLPAPAAQPRVRGLAASRHSSGAGLSSSGKFNFHVPSSARQ